MKTLKRLCGPVIFLFTVSAACLGQSSSPQVQKKLDDLNAKRVYYEKLEQVYRDSAAMIGREIEKLAPQPANQPRATTAPAASLAPAGQTATSSQISSRSTTQSTDKCGSVQCAGTTKKGDRCRNKTTNCNGRCHLH